MEASNIPEAKKERKVRSNVKVMLTDFFDSSGVVHHEYAPHGTTITKEYYQEVLRRLRDAVRRKRPGCGQWSIGSSITITHLPILHI